MKAVISSIVLAATLVLGTVACNGGGGGPQPFHDEGEVLAKHASGGKFYLDIHNDRAGYFTVTVTQYTWNRCDKGDHWDKEDGCS